MIKKLFRFFFRLIVILVLFTGILFLLSKLLEQKTVNKAITALNNDLDVPVYVESISFSLINKFPYATLLLKNVTVLPAKDFNRRHFNENYVDTLVFIKELYLSMNMLSLLNNELELTKAYVHNGQINILVDKNGKENYKILKTKQVKHLPDTLVNNMAFMLNQIQLKNVELRFINRYKKTGISIYAPAYTLNGSFYKKQYKASSKGKLLLNYFEQGKIKIHPAKPAKLNLQLSVDNNNIEIIESSLQNSGVKLSATGIISLGSPVKVDLKIAGTTNNINELLSIFSSNKKYKFITQGQLGVSAVVKGTISSKKSPIVAANFKLENGSISEKKHHLYLDKIAISGSYSNGNKQKMSTSKIDIDKFLISTDSSSLSGSISIYNFNKPVVTINSKVLIHINDIAGWLPDKSKLLIDGQIGGEFYCKGFFDTKAPYSFSILRNWTKNGNFVIKNGVIKASKPKLNIEGLTVQLAVSENMLSLKRLKGTIQNSKIEGGFIIDDYFTPLVDSTANIDIVADISANQIYYKDFSHFFESSSTDAKNQRGINFKGSLKTDKFVYKKLIANNAHGNISYKNKKLQITDLEFNAMGGTVQSQLNYFRRHGNKYTLQTNTITDKVNIKLLFSNFNNFGQTHITDKNIGGQLTSNFDFEVTYNNGKFEPATIELLGHLRIDNGELINFGSIKEVAKYSDIEELKHIKFSLLENDILITGSTVNIPKMDIISNAFDISLYGWQKFDGDYEYHMRVNLADFMGGKSKRLAKQQSEFGYIVDDGHGKKTLYLVATSKNDKTKVSLDSEVIKKNIKKGFKEEKKEFKKALHDEFGWFKKDTTLNKKEKPKKNQEFIIEWDEE